MQAREIMTRKPIVVRESEPMTALLDLLVDSKISGVPVVSSEGLLCGVVTEHDLLRKDSLDYPVALVMTTEVYTAEPDASVDDVARILLEKGIKRVVIVRDDRPVGIVSRRDILRAKLELAS